MTKAVEAMPERNIEELEICVNALQKHADRQLLVYQYIYLHFILKRSKSKPTRD